MSRSRISRRQLLVAGGALLASSLPSGQTQAATPGRCRDGRVQLPDGRWLSYREYGVPSGPLAFYFHGTPGSRIELALNDVETKCRGLRVIAVDRPGMGRSTYDPCRRITDWPSDVEHLASALGYNDCRFGIVGLSGGAPYASVCAAKIPHRLTHVAIVSGHAPMRACGTCPGNQDKLIELVSRRPKLGKMAFNVIGRRLDKRPDKVMKMLSKSWSAADRKLIFCNPKHYRNLVYNIREAVHCGSQGIVKDIQLLNCNWGFCLSEIQCVPVSIWQGGCDPIVNVSMAKYFHKLIAGSQLTIDPEAGHITMFKDHAYEILETLVSCVPDAC